MKLFPSLGFINGKALIVFIPVVSALINLPVLTFFASSNILEVLEPVYNKCSYM